MTLIRNQDAPAADPRERKRREFGRRRFLQAALAAGSAAAVDPKFFFGTDKSFAGPPLGLTEHVLVLIELDGGNDGLNTLIPYTDNSYYGVRGGLAIAANTVLPVGAGLGFHPSLPYLKARWDAGDVAVVRGVGHVDLDHSHFSCMAKLQAGTQGNAPTLTGWVGRMLDTAGLDGLAGISVADGGIPVVPRQQCRGDRPAVMVRRPLRRRPHPALRHHRVRCTEPHQHRQCRQGHVGRRGRATNP
jgi:uncharacterized protein (DUF1501 family)